MNKPLKTKVKTKKTEEKLVLKERYFEGLGRRKTAVARVRIVKGGRDEVIINGRELAKYFLLQKQANVATSPFKQLSLKGYKTSVKVSGGGASAQAEAVRLGVSRALVLLDSELRSRLKALGFLRRDPRMVERKKYGLRKARRPQQWRKR